MSDESPENSSQSQKVRYPLKYAVIGITIHAALFAVILILFRNISGRDLLIVKLFIISWFILIGLILGISMFKQIFSLRTLSERKENTSIIKRMFPRSKVIFIAVFFILTLFIFVGLVKISFLRVSEILNAADLANLPKSAHDVHVYTLNFMFSGEDYLCFEAEPNDIEKFLAESPALKGIMYQTYTKDRMRLATGDYDRIKGQRIIDDPNIQSMLEEMKIFIENDANYAYFFDIMLDDGNEYFHSFNNEPSWFKNEIRGAGRYYNFSKKDNYWADELIVDDEKHIVYISRIRIQ